MSVLMFFGKFNQNQKISPSNIGPFKLKYKNDFEF